MLMNCLSDGRAISLPTLSTAAGRKMSRAVGVYAVGGISMGPGNFVARGYFWLNTVDRIITTRIVNNQVPYLCQ